jgi:hypothetical protein
MYARIVKLVFAVAVVLWGDACVRFKETIEEGYVFKSKAASDFFDRCDTEFELGFGIGDNGIHNEVACSTLTCLLDGGA